MVEWEGDSPDMNTDTRTRKVVAVHAISREASRTWPRIAATNSLNGSENDATGSRRM